MEGTLPGMSGCVPEEALPTTPGRAAPRRHLTDGLRGDPQHGGERSVGAANAIGPAEGRAGGAAEGESLLSLLRPLTYRFIPTPEGTLAEAVFDVQDRVHIVYVAIIP